MTPHQELSQKAFFWTLQGLCALHRKPFSQELARQQCAAPYTRQALQLALNLTDLDASSHKCALKKLDKESFPLIAWCREPALQEGVFDVGSKAQSQASFVSPAMILQADGVHVLVVEHTDASPHTISIEQFKQRYIGQITRVAPRIDPGMDADSAQQAQQARRFGFRWFVPELLV